MWLCLITTVPTENVQRQSHMMQIALQVTFLYYCNSSIKQPYCWGGEIFRATLFLMLFDEMVTYVFSKGCFIINVLSKAFFFFVR